MKIHLKNQVGIVKEVKVGYSWTTLFFGLFPALFRGDLKWAAIMFISSLVAVVCTVGFGGWIPSLIFSFIYNKMYIQDLLTNGYEPVNDFDRGVLRSKGIVVADGLSKTAN